MPPSTITTAPLRPELGDFSSIVCFKAVVVGVEEALGEKAAAIALISAGRARGKQVAANLQLAGLPEKLEEIAPIVNQALGKDGTRLCIVDKIVATDETIRVYCRETVCSAGEAAGSNRKLTFTLGAIQGVLEQVTGKRLRGKQIESVLQGSQHDVVEFVTLG